MSIIRLASLTGLNDNIDVTCKLLSQAPTFNTSRLLNANEYPQKDVAVPYFSWTTIETALIIITGSMPFLRPLLATILPNFFSAANFTSLFASSRAKSRASRAPAGKTPDKSGLSDSTGSTGLSSLSKGDVTITTEFHLEENMGPGEGGFDARPPGTPTTPLAPRLGFRAMVTCEKGRY